MLEKKKLETVAGHLKANSNLDTCPIVSMLCKNENLFFVVIYPEFNMTTVHYLSKYLTLPAVSSLTFLRKPTRKRTLKFNPAFPLLKYLERLLVNTITLDSISGYNLITITNCTKSIRNWVAQWRTKRGEHWHRFVTEQQTVWELHSKKTYIQAS